MTEKCKWCDQEPHKDLIVCNDNEQISLCKMLKKARLLNGLKRKHKSDDDGLSSVKI